MPAAASENTPREVLGQSLANLRCSERRTVIGRLECSPGKALLLGPIPASADKGGPEGSHRECDGPAAWKGQRSGARLRTSWNRQALGPAPPEPPNGLTGPTAGTSWRTWQTAGTRRILEVGQEQAGEPEQATRSWRG